MKAKSEIARILNSVGLTTRDQITRGKRVFRGAMQYIGRPMSQQEMQQIAGLYSKLHAIDHRRDNNFIPPKECLGLGFVLARFLFGESDVLQLVSFASPAYVQDHQGNHIDIKSGDNKVNYQVLPAIDDKVHEAFGEHCMFAVYLSDIDCEVQGKSDVEVEAMMQGNLQGLKRHFSEAKRLSELVAPETLQAEMSLVKDSPQLLAKVTALADRKTVLAAHKIKPEQIRERATVYAALGRIFERDFPDLIVLDVQTRVYPYEQPFYNVLRQRSLPLIRPVDFANL